MRGRLGAVVERRPLIRLLIGRDVKLKYEESALGYFWSILEPLLLAGVYWFVFSKIGRLKIPDYPLFIISAIMPWLWVSGVISSSTRALTGEAKLIKTSPVPREVWVVRVVGAKGADFLLALPVVALFALFLHHPPTIYLFALPLAILIQAMLLTGVALLLSCLSVIFADVQRLTRVITRLLFYVSPIVYDVRIIKERLGPTLSHLYQLNPLVGIFELYHAVWYGDRFTGWAPVALSGTVSVVFLLVGWLSFARLEPTVLKEL